MTRILLFCVALLATAATYAQNKTTIVGTVTDNTKKPISTATVSLLKAKDSSLVKTAITEKDGKFEIATNLQGKFLVSYQLIGFEKKYGSVFEITAQKTIDIATVQLEPAVKKLEGVTVVSRKPMIEVKADKTIFNVENSINATGSDAFELLQKSPGIQVDNNDNISMKGKTGVRVYIDGKMTQLDTKDLAAYLKSINSNDVEAIEMISNPSAKYDASGNAGIINIRLKKNKKYGTNGTANLGFTQGITPKANGSVNLNYRNKKVNFFSTLSGNLGQFENGMYLYRKQLDSIYDQNSTNISKNENINAKVGADFFIDSKQTFGVMVRAGNSNNDWSSSGSTPIYYNPTGAFVKRLDATNSVPQNRTNVNSNINYRYADTSGTEINIDGDYGYFRGTSRSVQPNNYFGNSNNLLYSIINKNNAPTDIDIFTLKADVEMNKWKGKLGFGVKTSFVKTYNVFDFFNVIGGNDVFINDRSNRFTYNENVNAAYVNYQRQLSTKWSLQTGLRVEQSNTEGNLVRMDGIRQTDDNVVRNYTDLFPSAALTWNINKKHTLNLTYSRRIDRPTYQDLNPFENKLDELTFEKGNAFLRPQYTDNVELTHTFLGFLNTTVGYSYVNDFATQVTDTIKNATYVQQQNLATQRILNFSIGSPLPIAKWWNGYSNIWYNYQMFKGAIGNNALSVNIPMYGAYMQHTFTLGKDYTAELSGWFNGPSIWGGTWRTRAQGGLDAGIQKLFLKKKATVKLSVTDMLFTNPWKAINDFGGVYINGGGNWESRTVRLNFSYRFGSNQIKGSRQRKSGLESEANRIKGGN
jgi:iron complex outermembrane recepter protein